MKAIRNEITKIKWNKLMFGILSWIPFFHFNWMQRTVNFNHHFNSICAEFMKLISSCDIRIKISVHFVSIKNRVSQKQKPMLERSLLNYNFSRCNNIPLLTLFDRIFKSLPFFSKNCLLFTFFEASLQIHT